MSHSPAGPLIGMDVADLTEVLGSEQPAFRARQLYEALYRQQVFDIARLSSFPQALRADLQARHNVGLPQTARVYNSVDGTRRYLLCLQDGRTVEAVLM